MNMLPEIAIGRKRSYFRIFEYWSRCFLNGLFGFGGLGSRQIRGRVLAAENGEHGMEWSEDKLPSLNSRWCVNWSCSVHVRRRLTTPYSSSQAHLPERLVSSTFNHKTLYFFSSHFIKKSSKSWHKSQPNVHYSCFGYTAYFCSEYLHPLYRIQLGHIWQL